MQENPTQMKIKKANAATYKQSAKFKKNNNKQNNYLNKYKYK